MAFTYNTTTDLGKTRLAIGDTVDLTADDESLTDAEIQIALDQTSSVQVAAVYSMEFLIARLRKKVTRTAAGVNSSQREKLDSAIQHYEILKARAGVGRMHVYSGNISQDRIDDEATDTDFPERAFTVGMDNKDAT